MITEDKKFRFLFQIFTLLCFVAVAICMICDFALNKRMSWSTYSTSSIIFGWAVTTPLLIAKKNKIILSFASFTILLLPYLYAIERFGLVQGWLTGLGIPLGITVIIALWISYGVVLWFGKNRSKSNIWYLSATMVFIYGVVGNFITQYFVSMFLSRAMFRLDTVINLVASVALTVLLVIIGNYKKMNDELRKNQTNNQ